MGMADVENQKTAYPWYNYEDVGHLPLILMVNVI